MKVLPPVRYRLIGLPGRAETEVKEDKWSRWLKDERWPDRRDPLEAALQDVRDHILELARLQWGEVVVDLGAGTGLLGLKAAPLVGPDGVAFFLDISRDSLESAASQATTGRECFVVARAERCPLAAASIDAVVMRSVLIYMPDRGAAAGELARILKPRGRVVAYEPINRRMGQIIDMADFPDIDEAYQSAMDANPLTNFDEHDLVDAFRQADFTSVDIAEGQSKFPVRGKEWAHGFRHGAPAGYSAYDMVLSRGIKQQRADQFLVAGERQLGDKWTIWTCPFVYLTAVR